MDAVYNDKKPTAERTPLQIAQSFSQQMELRLGVSTTANDNDVAPSEVQGQDSFQVELIGFPFDVNYRGGQKQRFKGVSEEIELQTMKIADRPNS